jgi:hypothetical protein
MITVGSSSSALGGCAGGRAGGGCMSLAMVWCVLEGMAVRPEARGAERERCSSSLFLFLLLGRGRFALCARALCVATGPGACPGRSARVWRCAAGGE